MTAREPILVADKLTIRHGQLTAVHDVSLSVAGGELFAVVGANGAGKSTLLRTLAGSAQAGQRHDHAGRRGHHAAVDRPPGAARYLAGARGPSAVLVDDRRGEPQGRQGQRPARHTGLPDRVFELFPGCAARYKEQTAHLSGGEQQVVAIGRALVANPRVLLLDEISLGLAPVVVKRIYETLPALLDTDMAVLVVEQDVAQALRVADRFQCLLEGRTTLEGKPSDYTTNQVEAAYFGFGSAVESWSG